MARAKIRAILKNKSGLMKTKTKVARTHANKQHSGHKNLGCRRAKKKSLRRALHTAHIHAQCCQQSQKSSGTHGVRVSLKEYGNIERRATLKLSRREGKGGSGSTAVLEI
ncbi:unnamed protein product [Ixodes pacificus]